MKVLVTFALESEFAPWRRVREFVPLQRVEFPGFESVHGDLQIRVALTGVGPERAQRVARAALTWKPNVCISAGFAGGLQSGLRAGDVFVALAVRDGETHRTVSSDPQVLQLAEDAGASRIGTLCTSAYVIASAEDKQRMSGAADAVDMESFFILNAAKERGVAALAIRAVSDASDESLPLDFTQILSARGQIRISRLIAKIARFPQRIPALIRLGAASRRGAQKLAGILDKTIETMCSSLESHSQYSAEIVIA